MAVSYRKKENDVKMTAETTNGGVRSNGGGREYTRVCLCLVFLV